MTFINKKFIKNVYFYIQENINCTIRTTRRLMINTLYWCSEYVSIKKYTILKKIQIYDNKKQNCKDSN